MLPCESNEVCDADGAGGVLLVLRAAPLEERRGGGGQNVVRLSKITVALLELSVVPVLSVVATMTSGSSGQCN